MRAKSKQAELSSEEKFAMNASLGAGALMLLLKWTAYILTHSAAALSDASETIAHLAAVGFAAYSLRVAYRPPNRHYHFGHDKITYFSSGLEGGLIAFAGVIIIVEAVQKWITGIHLEKLNTGIILIATAMAVNTVLGVYLIRTGRKYSSRILVANGKHVLSDAWTSAGVIIGLLLALWTGILEFDPIFAIFFALNILYEGGKLVRDAGHGLMDRANPQWERSAAAVLEDVCRREGLGFHRFRLRESGTRIYVDFHLLFPNGMSIEQAHTIATQVEETIANLLTELSGGLYCEVLSHLESKHTSDHDEELPTAQFAVNMFIEENVTVGDTIQTPAHSLERVKK